MHGRWRWRDVGPAGVDKGKGGKYLILPPGYKDRAPDGYIALPAQTYTGFFILRSNRISSSDADVAKAVAYGKRVRFYPLSQAANPPQLSSSMPVMAGMSYRPPQLKTPIKCLQRGDRVDIVFTDIQLDARCCLLWDGKHRHPELVLRRSIPRLRTPL